MHSGSRGILYTPPPATDGARRSETDGGADEAIDQKAESETAEDTEAAAIVPPADD